MISWGEELRIGHPVIDADHKRLIDITNDFFRRRGKDDEKQILHDTLRSLLDYARGHFLREEKIQKEAMYPYLDMHATEHRALLKEVEDLASTYFIKKTKPLDEAALAEVRELLRHWLIDHIRKFDTNMRDWVQPATPEPGEAPSD